MPNPRHDPHALRIYETPTPSVGLVIGTYGSVPYVHLHLESWRRLCPEIPVLVHDDASAEEDSLRALCARYGADFSRNTHPHGHFAGDMTVFTAGMRWGRQQAVDLLVKFSRRFIPRAEWVMELRTLAYLTQYATFSGPAEDVNYGFRTECLGLHLGSWLAAGTLETMEQWARETCGGHIFNEAVMHDLARQVGHQACLHNRLYETVHPPPPGREAYAPWPLLGTARCQRLPHLLWHEAYTPFEFYLAARAYGLTDYLPADFDRVPAAPEIAHD